MGRPKYLAMQNLGVKGNLGEHGKFKQCLSLTPSCIWIQIQKRFKHWIPHFITTWICISHHHAKFGRQKMKQKYIMNSNCFWAVTALPHQHRISSRDLSLKWLGKLGTETNFTLPCNLLWEWWDHCTSGNLTTCCASCAQKSREHESDAPVTKDQHWAGWHAKQRHAQAAWNTSSTETRGTHRAPWTDSSGSSSQKREVL